MSSNTTTIDESTENYINEEAKTNEPKKYSFEFKGNAMEYFKIWIVNFGLSVITLGIYSAWAKVRNKQYLYGNTILDSSSFQYTANPIGILKGRIIAAILFSIYMVVVQFFPEFTLVFFGIFFPLLPWMVIKTLRFKSRYTRYRNINFHFSGTMKEGYKYWFFIYLLVPLTLGIIGPYIDFKQKKFIIDKNNFGKTPFQYSGSGGDFYSIYILGGLMMMGFFFLAAIIIFPIIGIFGAEQSSPDGNPGNAYIFIIISYLIYIPIYLFGFTYIKTSIFNNIFNNTKLADIKFKSTMKVSSMFGIYLTNLLSIVATAGLLIPWSIIRTARYRVNNLSLETDTDLDSFSAAETENFSATGEEIGEVFDFDLSI